MALNPLAYTEKIVKNFLRYQLTSFAFSDESLERQLRERLSLDATRETPLLKGPYVSLSQAFQKGATIDDLVRNGLLHPHMKQLVDFPEVFKHQEQAIGAIHGGQTTIISTGTGSGKSECFLYPIVSRCLEMRDQNAAPGVVAIIVYPMNALAEDQLLRLRRLLAGTGIPFGMYVGKTPELESGVVAERLPVGASREDYLAALKKSREEGRGTIVVPPEEVCSREVMRTPGCQPRILLTNTNQLELLLTRQADVELFDGVNLQFLVFDEAHTFTGAKGAETACLVRRLRSFCGRGSDDTVCIATSATIVDATSPDPARDFAARFFGVERDRVELVQEAYEPQGWSAPRTTPPAPAAPEAWLKDVLEAVDAPNADRAVAAAWRAASGTDLPSGLWTEALYQALSRNELLYQAAELLKTPRRLSDLAAELAARIGRPVSEHELIGWLTLGAAARDDDRPLVRPVVHAFVRGIQGAVATFDPAADRPTLHLSAEEDIEASGGERKLRLPILTCTTCGQHYFVHWLGDFRFTGDAPQGGEAAEKSSFWPSLDEARGGKRLLLVDRLTAEDAGDEDDEKNLAALWVCRVCGAAHPTREARCLGCGEPDSLVKLYAVRLREDPAGRLVTCLSCGAHGGGTLSGRYREPAKPVRATAVADVHVLAQDMIHNAERKRLLVFADNRQEAAFQAGWMQDHARRFRLRALMSEALSGGRLQIDDLVGKLETVLERDETLSRMLLPEVWNVASRDAAKQRHIDERRRFLRILVLREATMAAGQSVGLEPWGRMRVDYIGLDPAAPFIVEWAGKLGVGPDELHDGIAALLDVMRRRRQVLDRAASIFTQIHESGDIDVQRGYLPEMRDVPKGAKLTRSGDDDKNRLQQWLSATNRATTFSQAAQAWAGGDPELGREFLKSLWGYLTADLKLIVPATLSGSKGRPLPRCSGACQLDADKFELASNSGLYRCGKCRRAQVRRTPRMRCLAYRCDGTLFHESDDPDNYDLHLIDERYSPLLPREHTAMVPHEDRERIETYFKGEREIVNTLVCTQTLELGVDIGALDAVLMRNVPPRPANYWQRAGRAGRRHRMAVDVTYCRTTSHDRAYFADPMKLLGGPVDPPSFNLSNDVMVRKHIHATILTELRRMARPAGGLCGADRAEVVRILELTFPRFVAGYLFDNGAVRSTPLDVSPLNLLLVKHAGRLQNVVEGTFIPGWPPRDEAVISPVALGAQIAGMADALKAVVGRLWRRLTWAQRQLALLEDLRRKNGTLDQEQQRFRNRTEKLIERLKKTTGEDAAVTYSVLALEGFLPGYGLEAGAVLGMAEAPRAGRGMRDFDLPRPPSVAVREYVPGNLIYANGHKYVPRRFILPADDAVADKRRIEVNVARRAVQDVTTAVCGVGAGPTIVSVPSCDVNLVHASSISDEEENRFMLPVVVLGRELGDHNGGRAYRWGDRSLLLRHGTALQLVNIGVSSLVREKQELGYPICLVCGQSVSPFSSTAQREQFVKSHTEWCGKTPEPVALHADLVADTLTIKDCEDWTEAYSLGEALRFGAADVLEMELEDLQLLVVGQADTEKPDAILYDPMPGGSGLLEQLVARFEDVVRKAKEIANCSSGCATSCIDCFRNYNNAFHHAQIDRNVMRARIDQWGCALTIVHQIPAAHSAAAPARSAQPVNAAEQKLKDLLMSAGFPDGRWQEQRSLPPPEGSTTPDVTYDNPDDPSVQIYIYLDGLSSHIHGNAETQKRDRAIRSELRAEGHDVIEIAASDLDDDKAMDRHLRLLARRLGTPARSAVVAAKPAAAASVPTGAGSAAVAVQSPPHCRVVQRPAEAERFRRFLPLRRVWSRGVGYFAAREPDPQAWIEAKPDWPVGKQYFVGEIHADPSVAGASAASRWGLFATPSGRETEGSEVEVAVTLERRLAE